MSKLSKKRESSFEQCESMNDQKYTTCESVLSIYNSIIKNSRISDFYSNFCGYCNQNGNILICNSYIFRCINLIL